MYCAECLQTCDSVPAVVGCTDHWQDRGEIHYTKDVVEERSDCCEAELIDQDQAEERAWEQQNMTTTCQDEGD